ncbi:MAG TPA: hypothetical protein VFO39_23130 [Candidatus Sulfotelmatobacter sp.]|nr:hypothetical protein [Candidatus Sulfotelmatobacter sp.]
MQGETKERWREVCEQIAIEDNPAKFQALIRELNELLENKPPRPEKLWHGSDQAAD